MTIYLLILEFGYILAVRIYLVHLKDSQERYISSTGKGAIAFLA